MAARVTTLSVPFFSPENRIALGDLDAFPLSAARAAGPFASTRSQDSVEVSLYLAAFTFASPFFFAYYRQTFSFLSLFPFSLFFLSIGLHFFRKVERLAEYARRDVFLHTFRCNVLFLFCPVALLLFGRDVRHIPVIFGFAFYLDSRVSFAPSPPLFFYSP